MSMFTGRADNPTATELKDLAREVVKNKLQMLL